MLPNQSEQYFGAMRLVERHSKNLNTVSWIWGGFTMDIHENFILRDHDDLDYLTLNLHSLIPEYIKLLENDGWQTKRLENGDLRAKRSDLKIHLGHVEVSDKARWTHNGEKGSIWFPREWLNAHPRNFCGIEIHALEPEFQYVLLERPQMLNPDWKRREKDILAREYLRSYIERKGMDPGCLFEQVSAEAK